MLGSRIASLRKTAELSQEQLAKLIGVSSNAVSMYEQGRRTPSSGTLLSLSKALDVSVQYLLSGNDSADCSASMLPELLLQSGIGLAHNIKRRNRVLSDQETAVLLAALLTMEEK